MLIYLLVSIRFLLEKKTTEQDRIEQLLSQLNESDTDFMIGQNNHETQFEDTANAAGGNTSLKNINNSIQVIASQAGLHTIEQNITNKVCSEVNIVMTSFETRIQEAVLVIPRVE